MKRRRLKAGIRYVQILRAATKLAHKKGYTNITRRQIAKAARCSEANVTYHFVTMSNLRVQIMKQAVDTLDFTLIGQGVANNDPMVKTVRADLRMAALKTLM